MKAGNNANLILAALKCTRGGGKADPKEIKKAQAEVKKAESNLNKAAAAGKAAAQAKLAAAKAVLNGYTLCSSGVDGLKDFLAKYQQLNERVIGKAASYARPGDRLEVILQPRNPY